MSIFIGTLVFLSIWIGQVGISCFGSKMVHGSLRDRADELWEVSEAMRVIRHDLICFYQMRLFGGLRIDIGLQTLEEHVNTFG